MANDADDLERYRRDEMSPAERHAFEKKALEDPFLSDALSGSESLTSEAFAKDVGDLKGRFARSRTQWFTPIRIAAGVVVVVTAGWLVFRTTPVVPDSMAELKNDSTSLSDSTSKLLTLAAPQKDSTGEPDKKDASKSIAKAPLVKPTETQQAPTQPAPTSTADQSAAGAAARTEPVRTVVSAEALKEGVTKSEPTQAEAIKTEIAKTEAEDVRRDEESKSKRAAPSALSHRAEPTTLQMVTGTVREAEQGLPLAGVSVTEKDSKQKAETGPDGRYAIPVTSERPTLQYSYEGLKRVERKADISKAQDIMLDDDTSQKCEVLVFPTDSSASSVPIELAAPAGGLEAYRRYLEENHRVPDAARAARVHGKVTVAFEVPATGGMSVPRVMKSLGHGCDEELLRLIRSGPAWSPTIRSGRPQASTIWVKLEFVADR